MSGGSWDYVYSKFEDVAENLGRDKSSLRRALGKKVGLIAKAMHDIEWVDSSDYGTGDDVEAIKKALGTDSGAAQIEILKEDAEKVIKELKALIAPNK